MGSWQQGFSGQMNTETNTYEYDTNTDTFEKNFYSFVDKNSTNILDTKQKIHMHFL